MSDTRVTFRKVATGATCGLVSFVVGGFVAKVAIRYFFSGSPVWEIPAIVCGALVLLVVGILVVAPTIGARTSNRK